MLDNQQEKLKVEIRRSVPPRLLLVLVQGNLDLMTKSHQKPQMLRSVMEALKI